MPDWKKLIAAKVALAKRGSKPRSKAINQLSVQGVDARVPPGQRLVDNFPVLDIGGRPNVNTANWMLNIYGLVETPLTLNWMDFRSLPQTSDTSDFHCVTRWSQLDMAWEGVQARELLMMAGPLAAAKYVTMHGYDGYTTNLPLEALLDDDVMIAHSVNGHSLTAEHGGPVRIVVPKRYAWKGAKWLKAIELHAADRPGFWEVRGYHNEAFPFEEQRYSDDAF